ncbi:very short patch repair endonuclease [Ruegeria sp. MALMAid1280]|uniref:very short patch repair endonuclease n=1 Tax=Ruegeria sp. MALMAid1280 TaxID=3411634 RepID=UPI003B9F7BC3
MDKQTRSRMMSGIKGANTKPELLLRRALHARGFRYKIHDRKLPGRPDIVLPKWRVVIEVRGCFWHRHEGCPKANTPATNAAFWREKFLSNIARDRMNADALLASGWRVLIVWECAIGRILQKNVVDEVTDFVTDGMQTGVRLHEIGAV